MAVKKIVSLTEDDLHGIVKQISEGLIKSYSMDICKSYMMKRFPNILKIISLKYNPYMERGEGNEPEYNDFVGIKLDCDDIGNFTDIVKTANNLLGWFTSHIDLRQTVKNGYIPYRFYNFNGKFTYVGKNGVRMDLYDFLDMSPKLESFSIILEAKFSEVYHPKPNEEFYHATDKSMLKKIMSKGLIPRSLGNFPERIYLGKSVSDIKDMVEGNLKDMVLLKVDVSNIRLFKLYRDQRNPTAVFTYDNIPPSHIEVAE